MKEEYDRLLNQKEVAGWIGMSEAWLEQCRFKGVGMPYVKIGRACRYRTSDVQRWIDEHVMGAGI
jgi:predicted DNA-binding transcriptional regulator AlpA